MKTVTIIIATIPPYRVINPSGVSMKGFSLTVNVIDKLDAP